MDRIQEGKAIIEIEKREIVSKDMPVFYNPVMEINRAVSVLVLRCIDKKEMQIGSPLAGSGIREIRFLLELPKEKISSMCINDYDIDAVKSIKKNLRINKISPKARNIKIFNDDANLFLLNSMGFDYIDIDPFGTPNPFLDVSVKRISREGILAVTATDTAPLSGTYPDACMRKYWAKPARNELMHEIGLRILIRKCQLIGAQYDKALVPISSYSRDHYFRIFFICKKGKQEVDKIIKQQGEWNNAGPMWLGKLWDQDLAKKIYDQAKKDFVNNNQLLRMLYDISEESKIDKIGFFSLSHLGKRYKLPVLPKQELVLQEIRKKGFSGAVSHFESNSIRSDISEKELVEILLRLTKR